MGERSTKRQKELLDYVAMFIGEHGYGPSYREVMAALGYKSVSTVAIHIDGLISKGYLRKRDNSARSLEVVSTQYKPGVDAAAVVSSSGASASKEKWLVEQVNDRFAAYSASPSQSGLDELFVLVGALKILGMDGAYEAAKARLGEVMRG